MSLFERWQGLIAQPLQFVRQQSLGECFGEGLPVEVLQALHVQPRFRSRLEQLLASHYQLAPLAHLVTPPAVDLPVLLLNPAQFERLPGGWIILYFDHNMALNITTVIFTPPPRSPT